MDSRGSESRFPGGVGSGAVRHAGEEPSRGELDLAGRLLLVRHAESEWNAQGRWQGQADPGLSARGREQARALAAALAAEALDVLIASDLARAAETARIVADVLGLEPCFDRRLREHDVGAWSGLTHAEIASRWPEDYARFRSGDADLRFGGGESRRELAARVARAAVELAAEHPGRRLAFVTHGGWIRALVPGVLLGNAGIWRFGEVAAGDGASACPRAETSAETSRGRARGG